MKSSERTEFEELLRQRGAKVGNEIRRAIRESSDPHVPCEEKVNALLDALFESQLFVMRVIRSNRRSMDKLGERWTGALSARKAKRFDHEEAARFYREVGLSAPQIGNRIAQDEGRAARPYSERTVRRWLAKKGDATT